MKSISLRKFFAKIVGYDAARPSPSRASVQRETKSEDGILPSDKRSYLIASQRDAFRNTPFHPATALQLQVNVVGTDGGKLTFTTSDKEFNISAGRAFRHWAKHCGFTDGTSLNETLQLALIQLTHNDGDFLAIFDDGILTGQKGTGKIRVFEADEIKNITKEEFAILYGDGFYQSNGLVYNKYSQIVGAFVSSHGRNKDEFSPGEYIHLRLDTPADFMGSNWIFVAKKWRQNQGRGVSTMSHVSSLLQNAAETQASEVQAAKLNAGMGVVISETAASDSAASDSSGGYFDSSDADVSGLSDESRAEFEAAEAAENAALKQAAMSLSSGNSAVLKLSGGRKIETFKTERPNLNTVEFIQDLRVEAGTVQGLPKCFTTLSPGSAYTEFRGSMVMAERVFVVLRKKLEHDFLDWVAVRFVKWAFDEYPDGFEDDLLWRWPAMMEVDEGAAQTAIEKAISNGVESLTSLLGPEKVEKIIEQQSEEKAAFESAGLLYPASRTVSGGVVETQTTEEAVDEG